MPSCPPFNQAPSSNCFYSNSYFLGSTFSYPCDTNFIDFQRIIDSLCPPILSGNTHHPLQTKSNWQTYPNPLISNFLQIKSTHQTTQPTTLLIIDLLSRIRQSVVLEGSKGLNLKSLENGYYRLLWLLFFV